MSTPTANTERTPISDHELRTYWRGRILDTCMRLAGLLEYVTWGEKNIRKLPAHMQPVVLAKCHELLGDCCRKERDRGHRYPEIEQDMNAELWRTLKSFKSATHGTAQGDLL